MKRLMKKRSKPYVLPVEGRDFIYYVFSEKLKENWSLVKSARMVLSMKRWV